MQKFHHLRALALLGALILYFFLWPICCCAAKPTWRPFSMQMSEGAALKSNLTLSNQTYRDLMTKNKINDNRSTNDNLVDIAAISSTTLPIINPTEIEASATETDSTIIYELFDLRKGKRKFVSSHQVLSRTDRSVHLNSSNSKNNSVSGAKRVKNNKIKLSTLERNERSANLSHITGSARKIQLYIKNRFLQLLPDGNVNGTTDDQSDYSKLEFAWSWLCCRLSDWEIREIDCREKFVTVSRLEHFNMKNLQNLRKSSKRKETNVWSIISEEAIYAKTNIA